MTMPAQPQDPQGTGQPAPTEPAVTPQPTGQEQTPPYAKQLEALPESVRPLVEPTFKEWDQDVNQRFQQLHSQYEPWKPVIDNFQPEIVQGALQVSEVLQNNPLAFLQAFADAYPELVKEALGDLITPQGTPQGSTGEQGQGDLDPNDPIVQQLQVLQKQIETLSGSFSQDLTVRQQQDQQQALDSALQDLRTKHGDFDETYILSQMALRGATPDQAYEAWKQSIAKYAQPAQSTAPTVVPNGGGLPSTQLSPEDLDSKATKDLVAQVLANAAAQAHQA